MNARWLGSADTPDGPSLGFGLDAAPGMIHALEPFDGLIDDLLQTAPSDPSGARRHGLRGWIHSPANTGPTMYQCTS